jgi:O-acetyl-ADP-ribose deacetylase (regulator of RNase III)
MNARTADYKINNATFRVNYGDITRLTADALVSSDDNYLSMGGGVSAALLEAGGEVIVIEARKHIPLKIGEVAVTSAGKLAAKYIFHVATIDYTNMIFASEETIRTATFRCMQLADALGVRLIAFPALGTGVANFPFQLAAEVMTRTIADYLMGETRIELVTITLFARQGVREIDLNLFYERAVALASLSTQSKRLNTLMNELAKIVGQMNKPSLSKRVADLQVELERAQGVLAEKAENLERLEEIQDQSKMTEISRQAIIVSSEAQDATVWADKQLEAEVLRTKLNGLLTLLNIQTSQLNRFQIEKAKYGGQLVPPRLEIAIDEMNIDIAKTEAQTKEVRNQLIQLGGLASK